MNKAGKKTRDIKFKSSKNCGVMMVHDENSRTYARYLEERDDVTSYSACVPMDAGALQRVDTTEIRGDYFRQGWESDFQIFYFDGSFGIREVVKPGDLEKLAEVEKLELSRRYWALLGVRDWKVVVVI